VPSLLDDGLRLMTQVDVLVQSLLEGLHLMKQVAPLVQSLLQDERQLVPSLLDDGLRLMTQVDVLVQSLLEGLHLMKQVVPPVQNFLQEGQVQKKLVDLPAQSLQGDGLHLMKQGQMVQSLVEGLPPMKQVVPPVQNFPQDEGQVQRKLVDLPVQSLPGDGSHLMKQG
jgi:predicted restriction endonuclease